MGCLTTYGIGSAPPFYGTGYVPQVCFSDSFGPVSMAALLPTPPTCTCTHPHPPTPTHPPPPAQAKWYQWGFLFSILYLAVWIFVGGAWWKVRLLAPCLRLACA